MPAVRLIGVEAGGEGITPGRHAARFSGGSPGVLQGTWTYVLQDAAGNIELTHSVSAGLDYAAIGPEHAMLREQGRVSYRYATDDAALQAFAWLARSEGLLPALESAHAIAAVRDVARRDRPRRHPGREPLGARRQGRASRQGSRFPKAERRCAREPAAGRHLQRGCAAGGSPGLVTYVTAGDPGYARSRDILLALDRAGADVIELGVPFSEPLADGPVIQRATERALAGGMTLAKTLDLVAEVRGELRAPIVLFTYANPLYRFGLDAFVARAAQVGVDGVLALDLPAEEAGPLHGAAGRRRHRHDLPGQPDHDRRAAAQGGRRRLRLSLWCVAHRRHRHA